MFFGLRMLILAVVTGMFIYFFFLLRKQKIELRYCLVWIIGLVGIAVFCLFPHLLSELSELLGIDTPVNTLFLICIAFLACISISLTVVVSRLSDKIRKLAQNTAIAEFEENK